MRSVAETAARPERIEILAYVDDDDPDKFEYLIAVKNLAADEKVARLLDLNLLVGEPLTTPLILNVVAERAQGDVFLISNDDQIFRDADWDRRLDEEAAKYPDQIYCMWFNDGRYQETICTFPIVSRVWAETLDYVAPPLFEHFNADLWLWQMAVALGRAHYIGDILVEHAHPDTGLRPPDATTLRSLKGNRPERDRAMFARFERYRMLDASLLQAVIDGA